MLSEYHKLIESYKAQKQRVKSAFEADRDHREIDGTSTIESATTATNMLNSDYENLKSLEQDYIKALKKSQIKSLEEKQLINTFESIVNLYHDLGRKSETALYEVKQLNQVNEKLIHKLEDEANRNKEIQLRKDSELQNLRGDCNQLKAELSSCQQKIDETTKSFQKEIDELNSKHKQEMDRFLSQIDNEVDNLKSKMNTEVMDTITKFKGEIEREKVLEIQEINDTKIKLIEEQHHCKSLLVKEQNKSSHFETQINKIKDDYDHVQKQLRACHDSLVQRDTTISLLEQSIKSNEGIVQKTLASKAQERELELQNIEAKVKSIVMAKNEHIEKLTRSVSEAEDREKKLMSFIESIDQGLPDL